MIKNPPRRSVSLRRIAAETRRPLGRRSASSASQRSSAGFRYGSFDRPQLASWPDLPKERNKAAAKRDLRDLISAACVDAAEGASRKAIAPPGILGQSAPLELAKYGVERAGTSA